MGGWSDYFEYLPVENPANWVNNRFDSAGAARECAAEEHRRQAANGSGELRREMLQLAEDAKRAAAVRNAASRTRSL
jgi:hypothetical protein